MVSKIPGRRRYRRLLPRAPVSLVPLLALSLSLTVSLPSATAGITCSQIVDHGITYTFDRAYPCGTFATGDWWVVPDAAGGRVTVVAISPGFDGSANGWEVNPDDPGDQGFDSRIGSFDAGRVPALPYQAAGGESIVKTVSVPPGTCRPCVQTASVLTVLDEAPPGGGGELLRPPYPGAAKPLIPVAALRLDLLPVLAPVASAPTLLDIAADFEQPWLDHKAGWTGRPLHPEDSMPEYGADIARAAGDAALALMLEGDPAEREAAAARVVQVGVDLYHAYLAGTRWEPNGGHSPGRRILLALAATLLDAPAMTATLSSAPAQHFGEDGSLAVGAEAGIALWGQPCSETQYWNRFRFGSGSKTCVDPYGWIDGGEQPGGSYQFCCNSSPWRGSALALRLMPELQCAWPAASFLEYVDRWVERGAHSQPDPCAPYDGDPDNYGVTYGPDGAGGCIPDLDETNGIGRFPDAHGTNANQGNHGSAFHGDMWAAYRNTAPPPVACDLLLADGFESGDLTAWSHSTP